VEAKNPRPEVEGAAGEEERRPFLLRLPASLHEDLRAWAAQDLRSLNGHIEFLLREAVRRRKKGKAP
jgi:hypothetical protein